MKTKNASPVRQPAGPPGKPVIFFAVLCLVSLPPLFLPACDEGRENETARNVKGVAAALHEIHDETGGFGTLSFLTKLDITASQDGLVKKLHYREGGTVPYGETVIQLENPQITLALERAENSHSQAAAALKLARSRLLEGEFMAEAQLLSIEKAESEIDRMKKKWEEDSRKHRNQETLFDAGGINHEAIRSGRFILESEWDQILIMEKELEIRKVGCRDRDLAAAGIPVPLDEIEKRYALVGLITTGLRAEMDAAKARLDAAEKELRSARLAHEDLRIKSNASGVVGARYFEEGERVRAGEKIITLIDMSSLYAIFPVREKDALRIEAGMPAIVRIDGIEGERQGAVDLVYPQADSQSLSFLVRVLIGGETGDLRPGMFARVRIMLGPSRSGIFLPETALAGKKDNEAQVFVINGNTLSGRKVVLGQPLGDQREINSGIRAGEIAVLRPDSGMMEGSHVLLAD
ncbi:MAG: efflux RND transporter periplasmic adaptor subunit [Treponema sp.]|nr:efflux RND transporter periplasmic adaptor subunit [Treponema sp.]